MDFPDFQDPSVVLARQVPLDDREVLATLVHPVLMEQMETRGHRVLQDHQ